MVTYVYFWGHNQYGTNLGTECLSQWYERPFTHNGVTYPTCEHWMMYHKAMLFNDVETAQKILRTSTPKEVKRLGRQVRNFDAKKWDENKYNIVKQGNLLKFSQHKDLHDYICKLAKNNIAFVEASPYDKIWGIGMRASDPRAKYPNQWLGENLLGKALTEVRNQLIKKQSE